MLPNALVLRNALTKVTLTGMGSPREFLSLCEALLMRSETGLVAGELQELGNAGLVTEQTSAHYLEDDAGALLRLRCGTTYWDYSEAEVLQRDAADMLRFLAQDPPRSVMFEAVESTDLATASEPLQALAALAHQVFDTRGTARFHHEVVDRKMIPSIGARHGLGAYLLHRFGGAREEAQWVRINEDGSNVALCGASSCQVDGRGEHLLICANFERYQWRYRSAWVYQCIYLDLGHALAALKLLARRQGLCLVFEHARADAMGVQRVLGNEALIQVTICSKEQTGQYEDGI